VSAGTPAPKVKQSLGHPSSMDCLLAACLPAFRSQKKKTFQIFTATQQHFVFTSFIYFYFIFVVELLLVFA
jgi:hypothetical protein